MNKAYLLVVCVLAASFTGCLSDDTSDLEEQQNTEDETIEPVGNHNNETHDYDILIGEIQNLTDEIEELRLEIEELQSSEYQPPTNTTKSIFSADVQCEYVNGTLVNGLVWVGGENVCTDGYYFEVNKNESQITIDYLGPKAEFGDNYYQTIYNTSINCVGSKSHYANLIFYNSNGVIIFESWKVSFDSLRNMEEVTISSECGIDPEREEYSHFWSSISISLPEEPSRMSYGSYWVKDGGYDSRTTITF